MTRPTINAIMPVTILTAIAILWSSAPPINAVMIASTESQPAQSQPTQTDFDCTTVSEIPQIECEALVAIYNSTGGPGWTVSTNWLQTTTPCGWYGVTCRDGRVTGLDLDNGVDGNNLMGALPAAISDLDNLTRLYLGPNQLSSIPTEISNLSNLTSLDLSSNQLSGIPTTIGNLSNLTYLDLSSNQLSSIPTTIGNLSNLTYLSLYSNHLSSIPATIGNLSNLTDLSLWANQLSSVPIEIGNLSNLRRLKLSSNQLSSIPTTIGNLSNLTELWLSSNQLSSIPTTIGNLSNLSILYLSSNQLSSIPTEIGDISTIRYLDLQNNQLSSVPTTIGNLSNLSTLYLSYNRLRSIPNEIGNLSSITQLYLFNNHLSSIPTTIGKLSNLIRLYLFNNQLSSIPTEIGNLSSLTQLLLFNNQLSHIPNEIDNLSSLTSDSLSFAYNRLVITDDALADFLIQKDSDWTATQTVAPMDVTATALSDSSVQLNWTPIAFQDKGGYYEISYVHDGVYILHGTTTTKSDGAYMVSGLTADTSYRFRVRTYTPPHDGANTDPNETWDDQQNALWSEYSNSVGAKTLEPTPIDAHEPNNYCINATIIQPNSISQTHTFHETADTDWSQFTAPTAGIYRIEVTIPDDSSADVDLFYYTECDTLSADQFLETYAPGARIDVAAEAGQTFYIQVKNFDALVYGSDVSYNLSVRQMHETQDRDLIPGPAIVVAGRYRGGDDAQDNINQIAQDAYNLFKAKGRNDSEIFFLATDSSLPGYDEPATQRNLELAITDWAADYLAQEDVSKVLTLYLVDHGERDKLYLDNLAQEVLVPDDLDEWLATLEAEHPGLLVNVIIEACHAGSFITRRGGTISKANRVIITSSNENYDAYVSRHGAAFSDNLLTFLMQEYNLGYSYQGSRNMVQTFHRFQEPWIDANGNSEPNEPDDIALASLRSFANPGTLGDDWPPYIANIEYDDDVPIANTAFRTEVRHQGGNTDIAEVWGVVYPPDYTPPTGEAAYEDDGELNAIELDVIAFAPEGGVIDAHYVETEPYRGFTQTGVYRVVVHARDVNGLSARPVTVAVAVNRVFLPTVSR
ncbi:MAG: leucine-rich repeat domain-containing protein [Chloroflexota bacterium]